MIATVAFLCLIFGHASAQLLYKIEGNGLEKPSYLFGTHHMASLAVVDSLNLRDYVDRVDQIVGEVDMMQDPMQMYGSLTKYMKAPADSTLTKLIEPSTFEELDKEFRKWSGGLSLKMFDAFKPMVSTTVITEGIMKRLIPDFDANNQLDSYVMRLGAEKGKGIKGLETPEFQAATLFNSTPITAQIEDLVEVLTDPETGIEMAEKLNKAYYAGDLEGMMKLGDEESLHPEFEDALLTRRNANWLEQLPDLMSENASLIVVGALHLPGPDGLIEGLRKKGFVVEVEGGR